MTVAEKIRHSATTLPISVRGPAVTTPRADGVGDAAASAISRPRQTGHFLLHYFEMCAPMCIGFAIGDLIYFWAAEQQGYSDPFRQLPVLSVLIVTLTMIRSLSWR